MTDTKPVLPPDCADSTSMDSGVTPFGEWLESQRRRIAARDPAAAARLAEVRDQAALRALLQSSEGDAIIAALIGAKVPEANGSSHGPAWD